MISAVIFSRDRPMQLDLLLRSIDANAPGVLSPLIVLYRATDPAYEEGYFICQEEHREVLFLPDGPTTLRVGAKLMEAKDWSCCLTDDSVFYRPLDRAQPFEGLSPDVLCVSLRLGRNTTWCYPHNRKQPLPKFQSRKIKNLSLLVWDWRRARDDFGYPGSLDGHVFRSAMIRVALHDCPPTSLPNQIEEYLVDVVKDDGRLMACYEHSYLMGLPLNIVTPTHSNRNGQKYPHSVQELNNRFLTGERVDLEALDFSDVRGAHQEIPLVFR